jgi:hypothetical protein
MKNILITIMLSISAMLFTGCSTYNLTFEPNFVEHDTIKKISNKEEKLKVEIVSTKNLESVKKKPTSKVVGSALTFIAENSFAENALAEVMKQYFEEVKIVSENEINEDNLIIKPKLLNFEWEPMWGGQKSEFFVEIKVYFKNKEILNKIYTGKYEKTTLIGTMLSYKELVNYIKSKNIFTFYNEEFIPDLAKALKENQ